MGRGSIIMLQKLSIGIVMYILITGVTLPGSSQNKISWKLDTQYSADLTIMASNYKTVTGMESSETVDILRIYKSAHKQSHYDMYDLSELFSKELLFETSDRQRISKFFRSVQMVDDVQNRSCSQISANIIYHVLALDNDSMRAGYFLLERCTSDENEHYKIHPLLKGGAATFYYCGISDSVLSEFGIIGK